jgi:threonine dehydrogenase-like Zn-dependent dehydrogenase
VKYAGVSAGETALVNGQGLIGALSAKFLTMQGAKTVVTDVHPLRLERAKKLGAVAAIDMREDGAFEKVKEALGGGADIVVEASGQPGPARQAVSFIRGRRNGTGPAPRMVFQANYIEPVEWNIAGFPKCESIALYYPMDRDINDRRDVLGFVRDGKISAREFVGQIHPFRTAEQAYKALRDAPEANFSAAFSWE